MERLRQVALLSVGRAVGFSGLAIFTVMVGLSFEPVLALRTGGVLLLLLVAGLLIKAQRAPHTDHRSTEVWILLDPRDRAEERCAAHIGQALRDACLRFARWTAGMAAAVWGFAAVLGAIGLGLAPA